MDIHLAIVCVKSDLLIYVKCGGGDRDKGDGDGDVVGNGEVDDQNNFDEYHIIETSKDIKSETYNIPKLIVSNYDGIKIPYNDEYFDRIIISHCLEHIINPENFLF